MVKFPTQTSDCGSHSLALLDLFIFSDTSICFAMAFPPLRKSDNVFYSVFIDFLSNLHWEAPFDHISLITPVFMII